MSYWGLMEGRCCWVANRQAERLYEPSLGGQIAAREVSKTIFGVACEIRRRMRGYEGAQRSERAGRSAVFSE